MSARPIALQSDTVVLPAPELDAPASTLEQALRRRCSQRSFKPDALPLQTVSAHSPHQPPRL